MPDREKVMDALDCLSHGGGTYDCLKFPCPYGFYGYTDCHKWEIARDALALLKEQKTVLHRQSRKELSSGSTMVTGVYLCPWCKEIISIGFADDDYRFCPYCGRAVKWE